ncbi:MAG: hypothetical protein ACLQDF_07145, partial [Desulfomonilia bacterium]
MHTFSGIFDTIETRLFPVTKEEIQTELSEKEKRFVEVVSLMNIDRHMGAYSWCGIERKKSIRNELPRSKLRGIKSLYKE